MEKRSLVEQHAELFRLASARKLSRREVIRRGVAIGLSAPIIGMLLAACGGDDDDATGPTSTTGSAASTPTAGSTNEQPTATTGAAATSTPAPTPQATSAVGTTPTTTTPGQEGGDTPWYIDQAPGPVQPGGTATYLLYEDPDTLNPLIGGTGLALQVIVSIIEPLAESLPDGSWNPILVTEIPTLENGGISEDLLTVTWKLREGVVWHDGEPFTADDVKFTYEAASSVEGGSIVATDFAKIDTIEAADDLTVVVQYKEFNVAYLDQFKFILPRHATGEVADMLNWDYNRAPVGTGPFMFEEWSAADHVSVVKSDTYREEGKPYLDGINFLVVPAEESRAAQMLQGDAHIMLWPGESSLEEFRSSEVAKFRLAPGIWTLALRFNQSKPFDDDPGATPPHPMFGDLRVRQAIGMAIDRQRISTEVVTDVLSIDSILSVGWINATVKPWEYDPDAAMALLEEAGWVLDGDVRVAQGAPNAEDGTKFEFVCNGYTGFTPNENAQLAIQEDLAKVGISMKIENQDFAVIFGQWEDKAPRMTGDFDTLFYDGGFFIEPHDSIRRQYGPDQVPSETNPSGQNFWRWIRDDVGEWLKEAGSTPDIETRRAAYQKIADAMREDVVNIPVLQFAEGSAYSTKLHGFTVSTWEYSTWDCENWWLEQE